MLLKVFVFLYRDKQPDVTQTVASFTHLETLKCVCL